VRATIKLMLGETRLLPVGVAVLLAVALAADALAGSWWVDTGGFVLLVGVVVLLVAATRPPS
jgi:membrane protein implicated in regulation of membrane protease activity